MDYLYNQQKYFILDHEVHIWIVSLSNKHITQESLKRTLSYSELKKIDEFNSISERERYLYYRGILRQILSKYMELEPEKVILSISDKGKPYIKNSELKFNISHKNDLAVIALGTKCEIGVDIEYLRNEIDYYKIVKRFFTPEEVEKFNNFRPFYQRELFFRIWTMKEAIVKALGKDIVYYFNEFIIIFSEKDILGVEFRKESDRLDWWYQNKILLDDYVCSIVTTHKKTKVRYFNL